MFLISFDASLDSVYSSSCHWYEQHLYIKWKTCTKYGRCGIVSSEAPQGCSLRDLHISYLLCHLSLSLKSVAWINRELLDCVSLLCAQQFLRLLPLLINCNSNFSSTKFLSWAFFSILSLPPSQPNWAIHSFPINTCQLRNTMPANSSRTNSNATFYMSFFLISPFLSGRLPQSRLNLQSIHIACLDTYLVALFISHLEVKESVCLCDPSSPHPLGSSPFPSPGHWVLLQEKDASLFFVKDRAHSKHLELFLRRCYRVTLQINIWPWKMREESRHKNWLKKRKRWQS